MGYLFEGMGTFNEALHRESMFKKAVRDGRSFNSFQRDMMDKKLSYKRVDMLKDWNRAKSVEVAWRPGARDRAIVWYDKVAEPNMKRRGLTPTEFFGWMRKGEGDMFDTLEEQEDWLDFEDEVEEEFEDRYVEVA